MSFSSDRAANIAHYLKLAKEFRLQAEKPEFFRLRAHLLDLATEWAKLAAETEKHRGD